MTLFMLGIVVAAIIEALHGGLTFDGFSIGVGAGAWIVGWYIGDLFIAVLHKVEASRRVRRDRRFWDHHTLAVIPRRRKETEE